MHTRIVSLLVVLAAATTFTAPGQSQTAETMLEAAKKLEVVDGDLAAAIRQYEVVVERFGQTDRSVAGTALLRMAEAHQKRGDAEAERIYQRIVREFADQGELVVQARARLAALASPATGAAGVSARQVWTGEDLEPTGGLSPDGRYFSFTDWETGDLAVRDLATNTSRRLTNTGGWAASGDYASESVISPDGRHVAYAWFDERAHKNELRVVPLAAQGPAQSRVVLRTDRDNYFEPVAVTPDGRHVAVVRSFPDDTNQIGLVAISDGSYTSVKSLEWRYPERVSLSPDGRHLAYDVPAAENGSPRDVLLLALDGTSEAVAVPGPADDFSPIWAADGTRVLFLSNRTGSPSLWSVGVEAGRPTGAPVIVKGDIGQIEPLGMTRSGTLYYGISGRTRQNIHVAPLEGLTVTRAPVLVTEQFVNASTGPAWSPDGESLAFYSMRPRPTLVVRSMKTGDERRIAVPPGLVAPFNSGPRWFPDGRSVLVLTLEESSRRFYRVHLDSGQADLLHSISTGLSSFVLSPDGRVIFWAVQSTSDEFHPSGRLMRFDIETGRETELKRDEWFITVAISPDGTQLAYLKSVRTPEMRARGESPSMVEVMPAAGGEAREVFRDAPWLSGARYNTLAWAPDQRHLLFVREDGRLWRVPLTGGEPQDMGISTKARIKSPAVHPDGQRIVFATVDADNNELWVLENFLPR